MSWPLLHAPGLQPQGLAPNPRLIAWAAKNLPGESRSRRQTRPEAPGQGFHEATDRGFHAERRHVALSTDRKTRAAPATACTKRRERRPRRPRPRSLRAVRKGAAAHRSKLAETCPIELKTRRRSRLVPE